MTFKNQIKILFFCLYFGTIGKYILNQIFQTTLITTYTILIIDIIIIFLTLSMIKLNSRYLIFILIFVIISSISFGISKNLSLLNHINGIRETLVFICYFIIMEVIYKSQYFEKINKKFTLFAQTFLAIQIPISVIQFIKYGVGDAVGGTYELGGSGLLTLTIFLLIYYLIENKIKSENDRLKVIPQFLIYLLPITLNETKISFLLIIIFFFSFTNLKKIRLSLFIGVLAIASLIGFSSIYSSNDGIKYENPLEQIFSSDYLEYYLFSDVNENIIDVPRITKLQLGLEKLRKDGDLLLGKDYSAFMTNNGNNSSKFQKNYNWLLFGSIPYSFYLLITGGFAIFFLINLLILFAILGENKRVRNINSLPLLIFLISIFIIILFYNDSLRSPIFSLIFVYILFFSKRLRRHVNSQNALNN
jgi:hypothetical protein